MKYDEIILIINSFSFITLMVMTLLLCSAVRFKSESSRTALFIYFTTLPDFIYNICDYFNWNSVALMMAPIAYSANLTVMPFMLLLAHRAFNPYYRLRYEGLLHFLPAVCFAALVAFKIWTMPAEESEHFSVERSAGFRTMLTSVNFIMISMQLVIYSYFIFSYLRKVKQYIFNYHSSADFSDKVWVPRFITFIGFLMIVVMISSIFDPLGGFRLFYLINVVALGYLLYLELQIVHAIRNNRFPTQIDVTVAEADYIAIEKKRRQYCKAESSKENLQELEQYARLVEEYLRTSEVYTNPDLSLADVSKAMGISSKNISRAINIVLNRNFFNLVNSFRIEKSKALLLVKKEKGLTLETIAEQCGFNSRFTLNNAFKKITGQKTTEWLRAERRQK